jgi:hypothetical protein
MGKRKNAKIIINQNGSCRKPTDLTCDSSCPLFSDTREDIGCNSRLILAKQYLIDHPKVKKSPPFTVGNVVRIRDDLEVGREYGKVYFVVEMKHYLDKKLTIKNIDGHCFYTKESGIWCFSEEMFKQK